jgi:hypothetical protein
MGIWERTIFASKKVGHVRQNKKTYKLACGFVANINEYGRK